MACAHCNHTGFASILNIWKIQEKARDFGQDAASKMMEEGLATQPGKRTSADSIFIEGRVRCATCVGEAEFNQDMEDLSTQMGGDPWDGATYEKKVH